MKLATLISCLGEIRGGGGWKQLADDTGIDYSTISRVYLGKLSPTMPKGEKLEEAMRRLFPVQVKAVEDREPAAAPPTLGVDRRQSDRRHPETAGEG
jgi:transcriptional regulator with XRE-family HTH domain